MAFLDETAEQEVLRNKRIRGYIMRSLARGSDGSLPVKSLVNILMFTKQIVTPDIGKHLQYLADGGYIKFLDRRVNAFNAYHRDAIVQLTKKGVDLVEDTIQDGGIDV